MSFTGSCSSTVHSECLEKPQISDDEGGLLREGQFGQLLLAEGASADEARLVAPLTAASGREAGEADGQRRVSQHRISVAQFCSGCLLQLRVRRLQQPDLKASQRLRK